MIDVIFAFDVEDPINEVDDEAILRICRVFTDEEVSASLFVAGEKARVLRQHGRRDVVDAMQPLEICYHGNYWADFPIPALHYGQEMTWDDAVAFALKTEAPGLHDVAEVTGQFPVAWCAHQAQWCPQLAYALKLAGVRCWAGGPRGWFMNWLAWGRSGCTLSSQGDWQPCVDPTRRDQFRPPMNVDAEFAKFQANFDRMTESQSFITIVGHPNCWMTAEWQGLVEFGMLFRHRPPVPYPRPANFVKSRLRSPADIETAFEYLRRQIRWLKSRADVRLTSYTELCDLEEEPAVPWIAMPQLLSLAKRAAEKLNYITDFGTSFSTADILGMLTFACDFCWRQGRWPEQVPVQRLLGPTEPLHVNAEPVTLTMQNIFAGALAAYSIMMDERRIPGALRASFVDVGPGVWLKALAQFVTASVETGHLPASVTVEKAPLLPDCAEEPVITTRQFGSSNRACGLSTDPIREVLRRQSWSYRPAVRRTE